MNNHRYRIYHDQDQCTKGDLIRPKLTDELLEHEYDNLGTSLHIFCRARYLSALGSGKSARLLANRSADNLRVPCFSIPTPCRALILTILSGKNGTLRSGTHG